MSSGETKRGHIRVLVVEARAESRAKLTAALEGLDGIRVAGVAGGRREALEKARRLEPDVILLGCEVADSDAGESARNLHQVAPDAHIVMVTVWSDAEGLIEAVEAGAEAFVGVDPPPEHLAAAIRSAVHGNPRVPGGLVLAALRTLAQSRADPAAAGLVSKLTLRQLEVLRLLAQGMSNREIAGRLGLSERTVVNHVSAILDRLSVRSRAGAAWLLRQSEPS